MACITKHDTTRTNLAWAYEHDDTTCNRLTLSCTNLLYSGYLVTNTCIILPTSVSTIPPWSSLDPININQPRYPWYLHDPLSITTNIFLIIESGLLLIKLLLLLAHSVTDYELPIPAGAAINRFDTHSIEVSTLYPHIGIHGPEPPFGWTNDIPTEPTHCHDTLPATPTNSPLG